jgi:hypothetical protein
VLAVEPPERLRYTLFAPRPGLDDRPENRFTMEYSIEVENGGTRLTIVQEDPREAGASEHDDTDSDNPILSALKETAEQGPA